jgi:hypothetical protein
MWTNYDTNFLEAMIKYVCGEIKLKRNTGLPSKDNRMYIGIPKLSLSEYVSDLAERVSRLFGFCCRCIFYIYMVQCNKKDKTGKENMCNIKCHAADFFLRSP